MGSLGLLESYVLQIIQELWTFPLCFSAIPQDVVLSIGSKLAQLPSHNTFCEMGKESTKDQGKWTHRVTLITSTRSPSAQAQPYGLT